MSIMPRFCGDFRPEAGRSRQNKAGREEFGMKNKITVSIAGQEYTMVAEAAES